MRAIDICRHFDRRIQIRIRIMIRWPALESDFGGFQEESTQDSPEIILRDRPIAM